jgi:hypothetical protein
LDNAEIDALLAAVIVEAKRRGRTIADAKPRSRPAVA